MRKVIIIDDDEAVRESTGCLLRVHGFEVGIYESTAAFLADNPCLDRACLILDQNLRVQSGLAFMESRQGQELGVPVLMVTGRGDSKTRRRAMASGVAAFLEKPFTIEDLLATMARFAAMGCAA